MSEQGIKELEAQFAVVRRQIKQSCLNWSKSLTYEDYGCGIPVTEIKNLARKAK